LSYIPINLFDSVFSFQFKSVATHADTKTVVSTIGIIVTVHVYSDPFQLKLDTVPPDTFTSPDSNHIIASVNIQVTSKVSVLIHTKFVHIKVTHGCFVSTINITFHVVVFSHSLSQNSNSQYQSTQSKSASGFIEIIQFSTEILAHEQIVHVTVIFQVQQAHSVAPNISTISATVFSKVQVNTSSID
jgi:hypothetical protein